MEDYFDSESQRLQKKKINKQKAQAKSIVSLVGFFHDDPDITGIFKLNQFSKEIEYTKAPPWDQTIKPAKAIDDNDIISLKYHIARKFKIDYSVSMIMEGIMYYASQNGFHPVREYLNTLKWDGIKRLDEWLVRSAGADNNAYVRCVSRKVLVAAIARVMNPGVKFDHMMILEGVQGIGKSTLVQVLGDPWYDQMSLTEKDKDTIDAMRGKWIIEIDELVCFKKEDVERMRSFITRSVDRARLAYRRNTDNFPRQSIFIGTINPDGDNTYFKDQTGNRRYWPIVCGEFNLGWLREHRDQIFAEALNLYKLGENLFLDDKETVDIAVSMQEERVAVDAWVPIIRQWINLRGQNFADDITVAQLAKECLGIEYGRLGRYEQIRIGNVMAYLGYPCIRKSVGGVRERYYVLNQLPIETQTDGQDKSFT